MKVLLLTNEYPPLTYGGAGVHVDYLSREMRKLAAVDVRAFGDQLVREAGFAVTGYSVDTSGYQGPKNLHGVFAAAQRAIDFSAAGIDADIVHAHTWYAHMGGIVAKLCYGIPLVITVHSLEPLRPWKREQLGGGYEFSSWVERTAIEMADAVIAVSDGTRNDILRLFDVHPKRVHIIYNGIDTAEFQKVDASPALGRFGIDPAKPYVLFVGRITRQKGITYLAEAIRYMNRGYQVVLAAGAPDTPEIAAEMKSLVAAASKDRDGIFWIDEILDRQTLIQLYSGADVFCCPSIYEPFGIINLEAMACETAVVGACVGGIPEVVVHDQTGFLVPVAQETESPYLPVSPEDYARDLAHHIDRLMADPDLRARFAAAGRARAVERFAWPRIAGQTHELYQSLIHQ